MAGFMAWRKPALANTGTTGGPITRGLTEGEDARAPVVRSKKNSAGSLAIGVIIGGLGREIEGGEPRTEKRSRRLGPSAFFGDPPQAFAVKKWSVICFSPLKN